ncbi:hypothetical protein OsJ_25748 [Oryza sativa Japonica Group]|nr:hypothetical protein OsJ_25748 [Oryza sativa Japonica Group]BAD08933.1 hypothetical protein [Oryza sativa Japonica Group]
MAAKGSTGAVEAPAARGSAWQRRRLRMSKASGARRLTTADTEVVRAEFMQRRTGKEVLCFLIVV